MLYVQSHLPLTNFKIMIFLWILIKLICNYFTTTSINLTNLVLRFDVYKDIIKYDFQLVFKFSVSVSRLKALQMLLAVYQINVFSVNDSNNWVVHSIRLTVLALGGLKTKVLDLFYKKPTSFSKSSEWFTIWGKSLRFAIRKVNRHWLNDDLTHYTT